MKISFKVNDKDYSLDVEPNIRLVDILRDRLNLTGTKEGCGEGECGTCTVIMDKYAVHSCLVLASQVDGTEIITVEGLQKEGQLDKLQEEFIKRGAIQCGFCTPGMLMSAKALFMKKPNPTVEEIKHEMAGNMCRCTGYEKITEGVQDAAESN